ncbi:MAG: hypothetical protein K2X47_03860 [Bdellovibrionales bacterium]|nr:hypothetical protein [Bdellovibrionales bacterium]
MKPPKAISHICQHGALLVFPLANKKEPLSLWSLFFPRTKMKWEWNDDGDDRVAKLWSLMKTLSQRTEVVYSKWYLGRATFFSRPLFTAMLSLLSTAKTEPKLSVTARAILDVLEMDSPLSTREIKSRTDLQGKLNEATYSKAMKELFSKMLIVAHGEVEDGAFPSLAVGATRLLFEDLWNESLTLPADSAQQIVEKLLPEDSAFRKYFEKMKRDHDTPSDKSL